MDQRRGKFKCSRVREGFTEEVVFEFQDRLVKERSRESIRDKVQSSECEEVGWVGDSEEVGQKGLQEYYIFIYLEVSFWYFFFYR